MVITDAGLLLEVGAALVQVQRLFPRIRYGIAEIA
jgi:hypothetical protein